MSSCSQRLTTTVSVGRIFDIFLVLLKIVESSEFVSTTLRTPGNFRFTRDNFAPELPRCL